MQRLIVQKEWLLDGTEPIGTRAVKFPVDVEATCLIEGGRWLLAVRRAGKVVATYLDRADLLNGC